MTYDPTKHHRRSIRLKGYDYTQPGIYFITLVTFQRKLIFGDILDGVMRLNNIGRIVKAEWLRTTEIRPYVTLDEYVIMPNHIHGIIIINDNNSPVGATGGSPLQTRQTDIKSPHGPAPQSLGAMIAGFKSAATRQLNRTRNTPGKPVWQRNYYDHIIRDEEEWDHIRKYIQANPSQWQTDRENPNTQSP
jgi:REP element-mobilizing transposase RayT